MTDIEKKTIKKRAKRIKKARNARLKEERNEKRKFRTKLLKRIDWYIIKKFLGTYIFSIALILSIAVIFDINSKIDKFMDHGAPLKAIIFDYYENFIPYYANLFSPLFVFIAVIFFTSKLADNSEITAMLASGINFRRLMRPYLISAALISAVTFELGGYIIPKGQIKQINFEDKYWKKRKQDVISNIQLQISPGVVAYIERYEDNTKTGFHFSLDKFEKKKLVWHLTAQSVNYDSTRVGHWTIHDYMIRQMRGLKEKVKNGATKDTVLDMEPSDFSMMDNQQNTMTNPELKQYIVKQQKRGAANLKAFEVEYYRRIAQSFAAFILTLIGVSLSSRRTKGGMGLSLGVGLALSFTYILFQAISSTFSINGNMPPMIAVWLPNILYAIIGIGLYLRAPK
jgi:lipopolysaccharide export system permease protein